MTKRRLMDRKKTSAPTSANGRKKADTARGTSPKSPNKKPALKKLKPEQQGLLIFTAVILISALLLILADDGPFGFFVYLLFFLVFVLL